jgi:hypothetical protein
VKSKTTAAALLVITGLSMPVQAQQDALTLACKGTVTSTPPVTEDKKPATVSMGLKIQTHLLHFVRGHVT